MLIMIVSYFFTCYYDTKWNLPIVLWALLCFFGDTFSNRITCFFILASWASLWPLVIWYDRKIKWFFLAATVMLWWEIIRALPFNLQRPLDHHTLWFWVPGNIFAASFAYLFYLYFIVKAPKWISESTPE